MVMNVKTRAILALPRGLFSCDSAHSVGLEGRNRLISGRYSVTVSLKLHGKCSAFPVGASTSCAAAQIRETPDRAGKTRLTRLTATTRYHDS